MATNQYISVKVCGNPDSNSGFVPILLFNSPSFAVEDQFYVGFDNCSYFYTIKTTKTQTIYKLVKNNVRSYGAARAGSLIIAFSVPKNYAIEGGYTPYDVLEKLKNEFLKNCMTCKDPVRETYEFNSGRIDQHVLDEVACEFTISPHQSPNRVMNPNAPKGYIVKSDAEIEKLFHDINYPEFDSFSEVVIADSVNQTNYTPINNIQIPRPTSYEIYVDGVLNGICSDLNQTITASSQKSSLCYENKSVDFTIQSLIDGDLIPLPGIEIDKANERITVSTQGWAIPKRRKISIMIVPNEYEKDFLLNRDLMIIKTSFGTIDIEQDLSFTLVGEQIAKLSKENICPILKTNNLYTIINYSVSSNELRVELKKNKNQSGYNGFDRPDSYTPQGSHSGLQRVNISPVVDVQILIDNFLESSNQQAEITMRLITDSQGRKMQKCSQRVHFSRYKSGLPYEGHFFVPKIFSYSVISFSLQDNLWESDMIDVNRDTITLTNKDFHSTNKKGTKWYEIITKSVICILIALLLGLIIGYCLHDGIKSLFGETKPVPVSSDPFYGEERTSMTENQAFDFLKEADDILKSKDLEFSKVNELYNKYIKFKDVIEDVDENRFNNKVCDRIEDYSKVISYVTTRDVEKLKIAMDEFDRNNLHIWAQHAEPLKQILKDEPTIERFKNSSIEITQFDKIADVIHDISIEPENSTTYVCSQCGTAFENEAKLNGHKSSHEVAKTYACNKCSGSFKSKAELNDHKSKAHASQQHFECPVCGPNKWFNTNKELEDHKKLYHKEL